MWNPSVLFHVRVLRNHLGADLLGTSGTVGIDERLLFFHDDGCVQLGYGELISYSAGIVERISTEPENGAKPECSTETW